jgi:hypothetical protein
MNWHTKCQEKQVQCSPKSGDAKEPLGFPPELDSQTKNWEFMGIWGPWSWGTPASESPRDCSDVCWKLFSGLFALHMMQVQTTPSRANNGSEMISYICINDQHRSWMCILDIQLLSTSTANYKNPNSLVKWESDSQMKCHPFIWNLFNLYLIYLNNFKSMNLLPESSRWIRWGGTHVIHVEPVWTPSRYSFELATHVQELPPEVHTVLCRNASQLPTPASPMIRIHYDTSLSFFILIKTVHLFHVDPGWCCK